MTTRIVHIARDGKIIGQYPSGQLASLLDSGQIFQDDFCYSEVSPEWIPLSEFLKKSGAPKFSRIKEREGAPTCGRSSWHDRAAHRRATPVLAGWVAFLLALSVVGGAGFWIAELYGELDQQNLRLQQMEKQLADKEKNYQRMLFVSREIAEPGIVRGSVLLRNDAGKRVAMPGVQIFLFPRKAVEAHLEAKGREASLLPAGTTVDAAEFFVANFPKALASTTTDASGRYEFPVPEPGEYVVSTSIASTNQNGRSTRLWFVSFNSNDPLNTVVDITETNGVQQFIPSLMIVEGR
ncbi:MAG: hypothetical protein WCQ16_03645 [Verrucomicrobiae bacterium]